MGLPRAEVAELVVLVALLILRLRVAEQCPQREMDGLARIGEMEPAYRLLDQIVIDFDLDRLLHAATIPTGLDANRSSTARFR